MPLWLYELSHFKSAIILVVFIETLSLVGLFLFRRFGRRLVHYHEGANDAVSGTVQAIGVFYGITVGLIAVGVWSTDTRSADLVSQEAAAIGMCWRDAGGYPSPYREELREQIKAYTLFTIEKSWPAQSQGQVPVGGQEIIEKFEGTLFSFNPANAGQAAIHSEMLRAYNNLIEDRRLRIDAVGSGLSLVMWAVIWVGAAISIGVAYFFNIPDARLHAILVGLMGGFLSMVLFMIVINDKPFYGYAGISSESYQIILDRVMNETK